MSIFRPYTPPDYNHPFLAAAPPARSLPAPADRVLPEIFHATSNHPEYIHIGDGRFAFRQADIVSKGD